MEFNKPCFFYFMGFFLKTVEMPAQKATARAWPEAHALNRRLMRGIVSPERNNLK
jgi:hypothetical protein